MSEAFSSSAAVADSFVFAPPTPPMLASGLTGTNRLSEKTLELTFCSQFAAENAHRHFVPWPHRIVWFGLTQMQENAFGFDAATSLGGSAVVFQFKASHTVTARRGRRFKVEHDQMQILRDSFGHLRGSCYYVFPDVGTVAELTALHSNIVGNSWLVDVADFDESIPLPMKSDGSEIRKDNCHYAFLGSPASGTIEFHSQPFPVRARRAKELAQRMVYPEEGVRTSEVVRVVKYLGRRATIARSFFKNTVMAVFTDRF